MSLDGEKEMQGLWEGPSNSEKMSNKGWNNQKTNIGQLSDSSSVDAYKR